MTGRNATRAVWALFGLTVTATSVSALASVRLGSPVLDVAWPMIIGVTYVVAGAVILVRQPRNAIGWLLCTIGGSMPLGLLLTVFAEVGQPRGWIGADLATWMSAMLWAPTITLICVPLLLLFPDGRPPTPRWRWLLWCAAAFLVLAVVGNGFADWAGEGGPANPYVLEDHQELLRRLVDLAVLPGLLGVVGAVASLFVRYRRGNAIQRLQLKWFAAAAGTLLPGLVLIEVTSETVVGELLFAMFLSLPAVAIGVAVTRYRLYDIDRIVSRTVSYALLTALLAAVYAAGVVGLGGLMRSATGGGGGDLVVAGSTLAVAALFVPARRRIQVLVDRRFNRARFDAQRTVEAFGHRLRDEVDLTALTTDLRSTVSSTVQPATVGLWLKAEVRP